ncbi:MAG: LacI family transcriptional regulator [Fusobacteriaceae bacterium]|jgi:LacI family transcriptional regulator|nr:LacI family transcriptional regulator [Fusobacteriaceae bacterium]
MSKAYATLKDVAKKARTSAATVSYVLNDSKTRYISDEMRERVLAAAKELNYVKSSAASFLRGKKRKMLAVLVPQFANQFFTQVALAVDNVAHKHGYMISICNTFDEPEREGEIIERMQQQRMDGYIIMPTREGPENTRQLRELGVPLVIVDRPLEETEHYNYVGTKNYQCSYTGIRHLIKKGHRRIAFVGWDSGIADLIGRRTAYFDAMKKAKIPESEQLVLSGAFTDEAGYRMTREIIEKHKDVTAIFYAYNIQALGGVKYLREHGIQAGKDISVALIGTPDWAVIANYTRVDMKPYSLGKQAAQLMFELLASKSPKEPQKIILNGHLVEGTSVRDLTAEPIPVPARKTKK